MRNKMDLKIILLFCIAVAVAASEVPQNVKRRSAPRQIRPPREKQKEGKLLKGLMDKLPIYKIFESMDLLLSSISCPMIDVNAQGSEDCQPPEEQLNPENMPSMRRRSKAKSRQNEDPSEQPVYQGTLHHVEASFNGFMNALEAERTPDEVKESALNLMFDVFMGWHNQTLKVDSANPEETNIITRSKKHMRAESELGKISSFCEFLSVLTSFMDQCKGREKECLQGLAQIMGGQQRKEELMKRSGKAHQPILEAVKELADRLEQSRDPDDQNMALLANALLELYNDVQTHKPSVEANVIVILDVYNILQKVDNCTQNPQCCEDWYKAYGEDYRRQLKSA